MSEIRQKNEIYLEKMELTDRFIDLHEKLRGQLDLAGLCVSKAKTTHGISLFSVNSVDSHDLEPSVRIEIESNEKTNEFKLIKKEEEEEKEKIDKTSGKVEDVKTSSGQFRPFGVLESTAAKDARKLYRNAVETLLQLASTQSAIQAKVEKLKNF